MSANEKITMRQLQILIFLGAMGTGVIVLPRRTAEFASQDGWVIALGLTVLGAALGALVGAAVAAARESVEGVKPRASFLEFTGVLLTRPVAYFLGAALWVKLVLAAGLEIRIFMEITGEVLLPLTPMATLGAAMLAMCAYAAAKGIETRARVGEVLLAVMVLPFFFLLIVALVDTDFTNLQPVLVTEPRTLLEGALRLGFIFTGMECLLLVSPFVPREKSLGRAVAGAMGLAGLVITGITAVTIAAFGRGVADEPWPVLRMMDMLNLPGSFIERQGALMFSFWIITVFSLGNALVFFGGVLVKDIAKARLRTGVIFTTLAVFAVAVLPWRIENVFRLLDILYMVSGSFFLVLLPLLLLAAAKIYKWGQGRAKGVAKTTAFLLILILAAVQFTSCWDRVEIENRAFVVSMGIDKGDDDHYVVTLSVPVEDKEEEDGKPQAHVKSATAHTITEALKELDAKTDKQLYYGQTKLIVLGTSLLEDENLLRDALNAVHNKNEIDLRVHVLAAENPAEILEAKPPGETLPGLYVSEIYRSKNKIGGTTFALNFERLSTALGAAAPPRNARRSGVSGTRKAVPQAAGAERGFAQRSDGVWGGAPLIKSESRGAVIPMIAEKNGELTLYGAVILKDCRKAGTLTPDEMRGYLWCFSGGGKGAVVTAGGASMRIEKHDVKISFEPANASPPALRVLIDVEVEGRADKTSPRYGEAIQSEISAVAAKFQKGYALDGYDFLETLRKKNYPLYQTHAKHWHEIFPKLEIIPRVRVKVLN